MEKFKTLIVEKNYYLMHRMNMMTKRLFSWALTLLGGLALMTSCDKHKVEPSASTELTQEQASIQFDLEASLAEGTERDALNGNKLRSITPLSYDESNFYTGGGLQRYPRLKDQSTFNTHTYFYEETSTGGKTLVAYAELIWTISKTDPKASVSTLKVSCHKSLDVHPAEYSGNTIVEDRTRQFEFDPSKTYSMVSLSANGFRGAAGGIGVYGAASAPVFYFGSEFYDEIFHNKYLSDGQSLAPYYSIHGNFTPKKKDHILIKNVVAFRPATPILCVRITNDTDRTITKQDLKFVTQGVTSKIAMSIARPTAGGDNAIDVKLYSGQGINTPGESSLPFAPIPAHKTATLYIPCTLTSTNISPDQETVAKVVLEIAPKDGVNDIIVYGNKDNRYKARYTDNDASHFREIWLNKTGRFNLNTIKVSVVPKN